MESIYFQCLRESFSSYIDDKTITEFVNNSIPIEISKNDILIPQGKLANDVYYIVQGSFLKNVIAFDGEIRTVMFYTDSFFNFMVCSDSYVNGEETSYTIVANEDAVVLKIPQSFVKKTLEQSSSFARFYAHYHEQSYSYFEQTRDKLLTLTSEEYLKWLYENYQFIFNTFPSKSIASYIGISREWLSKLKRKILL